MTSEAERESGEAPEAISKTVSSDHPGSAARPLKYVHKALF